MPNAVNLAAYRLGIRLTECRDLHIRAISCAVAGPNPQPTWAEDRVWVQDSFRLLEEAHRAFAAKLGGGDTAAKAGRSIIRECRRLWRDYARLTEANVCDGEINGFEILGNLAALENQFIADLELYGEPALNWFLLGRTICDGYWDLGDDGPITAEEETREQKNIQEPTWRWTDQGELDALLTHVGEELQRLFPQVLPSVHTVQLLPYDRLDCWPWYRVEAALRRMLDAQVIANPPCSSETGARPQEPHDGHLDGVQASDDDDEQTKHRLVVDVEHDTATLDGTVFPLKSQDCARYLKALLDEKGDWVGPKKLTEHGLVKPRPDRLRKRLPEAIRNLVEIESSKGSRIALARLA